LVFSKKKCAILGGESFWASEYAVSSVGFEPESVKRYIREREMSDYSGQF
jgi:hypothetical protein